MAQSMEAGRRDRSQLGLVGPEPPKKGKITTTVSFKVYCLKANEVCLQCDAQMCALTDQLGRFEQRILSKILSVHFENLIIKVP